MNSPASRTAVVATGLPRRECAVTLGGLAAIALFAWTYLVYEGWAMDHMDIVDMAMPASGAWGVVDLGLVFAMWAIMMVGMMVPSVAPTVMLFARIQRERARGRATLWAFLAGYLTAWTAFSAAATLLQWPLHDVGLLSPMMVSTSSALGGGLLIAAGLYQWSPLKQACLAKCQSSLGFLLANWRDGVFGAWRMGVVHGLFCVGCCALLMLLLFVLGTMNLLWIAALSVFVLTEKLVPGPWVARVSGLALIAWGAGMFVR